MGKDFTLFAATPGKVQFGYFNKSTKMVSVVPA